MKLIGYNFLNALRNALHKNSKGKTVGYGYKSTPAENADAPAQFNIRNPENSLRFESPKIR
jgi:hypothetical protein